MSLVSRVAALLTAAVHDVLQVVEETESEYHQNTARTQRENQSLRRRLHHLETQLALQHAVQTTPPEPVGQLSTSGPDGGSLLSGSNQSLGPADFHWKDAVSVVTNVPAENDGFRHCKVEPIEVPCESSGDFTEEERARSCFAMVHAPETEPCHRLETETHLELEPRPIETRSEPHPDAGPLSDTEAVSDPESLSHIDSRPRQTRTLVCASDELDARAQSHQQKKTYSCKKITFVNQNDLKMHRVTRDEEKPYRCDLCGKICSHKAGLYYHQQTHTGKKPHGCKECGKRFLTKQQLTVHCRLHTGEKPFRCAECGKQFTQRSGLNYHKRIHAGERPYSCRRCDKKFRNHTELKRHEFTHTGEKPFPCNYCGKTFRDNYELAGHERGHTGEKTFACDQDRILREARRRGDTLVYNGVRVRFF